MLCCGVFHIDEANLEIEENLIALCPTCYNRRINHCGDESRARLKEIKVQLIQNVQNRTVLSSERLEHEI